MPIENVNIKSNTLQVFYFNSTGKFQIDFSYQSLGSKVKFNNFLGNGSYAIFGTFKEPTTPNPLLNLSPILALFFGMGILFIVINTLMELKK